MGLEQIDSWGAPHAAAAVVGPAGVTGTHGPVDHPFPLASVTKLLTAFAALVAVEEEVVALDDAVGPPGSTLAHLLAHASGLGPDGDVLRPPGAHRIYTNVGYDLVAAHVAGAAGMPFATYAAEAVTGPLGMGGTDVSGPPASGAVSTAADLSRLAAELMAPHVLAPETLAAATTVAFPGLAGVVPGFGRQDPCDWGLGPELKGGKSPHWTAPAGSPRTFGHFGQAGTFLWVDPDAEVALVCLTDRDFGPWAAEAWPILSAEVLGTAESVVGAPDGR